MFWKVINGSQESQVQYWMDFYFHERYKRLLEKERFKFYRLVKSFAFHSDEGNNVKIKRFSVYY